MVELPLETRDIEYYRRKHRRRKQYGEESWLERKEMQRRSDVRVNAYIKGACWVLFILTAINIVNQLIHWAF